LEQAGFEFSQHAGPGGLLGFSKIGRRTLSVFKCFVRVEGPLVALVAAIDGKLEIALIPWKTTKTRATEMLFRPYCVLVLFVIVFVLKVKTNRC
jgi:hypothetical protein